MKKFLLALAILILTVGTSFAQDSFKSIINDWADNSGFTVEKMDAGNETAVMSKDIEGTTQYLQLEVFDELVELKVLFYEYKAIEGIFGEDFNKFLLILFATTAHSPYGGWGILNNEEDITYFNLSYGIPIHSLNKEAFNSISNYLVAYAAAIENTIKNYEEQKDGLGFSGQSGFSALKKKIEETTKSHREKVIKELSK